MSDSSARDRTVVFIGTYTDSIHVHDLDLGSGAMRHLHTVQGPPRASYLALSEDRHTLYATSELVDDGGVSAFRVDTATGTLSLLNRVQSHGADPAHLSIHPTGKWLLVANYTGGTIATLSIRPDGALGEVGDVVHHEGSGPNPARQAGPHPHMIVTDPAGEFVLVPDLGLDAVLAYRLDQTTGRLISQTKGGGRLPPGAGPRHLVFGARGDTVYVINELASTVAVFGYDTSTGAMADKQMVRTLPDDFAGQNTTAALVIAPSGRFVYGSNRGHDSVAAFAVNLENGELSPRGHTSTSGRTPRDIAIDPSGRVLVAANQNSNTLVTFHVDDRTGALDPTGHLADAASPARVLFA
jgi:6-phosphogluconolactonase